MKLLVAAIFIAAFMATTRCQMDNPEVVVTRQQDGRSQVRAFGQGVVAMDTELEGEPQHLREISNGKGLIRLMLSAEDTIVDCQVDFEPKLVKEFLRNTMHGASLEDVDLATLVETMKAQLFNTALVNIEKLVAEKFNQMLDFAQHQTECGVHHSNLKHRGISQRRSARSLFIFPGTNWCGSGNQDQQLGESIDTDKCCREHDNCPYFIESMSQTYGHLNMRLYTISHCACDEHFRTCLRLAGTDSANQVGKWYFNYIKLDCFIFRPKQVCEERAWYGKCLQYKNHFEAEIRSALDY